MIPTVTDGPASSLEDDPHSSNSATATLSSTSPAPPQVNGNSGTASGGTSSLASSSNLAGAGAGTAANDNVNHPSEGICFSQVNGSGATAGSCSGSGSGSGSNRSSVSPTPSAPSAQRNPPSPPSSVPAPAGDESAAVSSYSNAINSALPSSGSEEAMASAATMNSIRSPVSPSRTYPFLFSPQPSYYISESDKLRKLRQKKESKEKKLKGRNVKTTFQTQATDQNYDVDHIMEEQFGMPSENKKSKKNAAGGGQASNGSVKQNKNRKKSNKDHNLSNASQESASEKKSDAGDKSTVNSDGAAASDEAAKSRSSSANETAARGKNKKSGSDDRNATKKAETREKSPASAASKSASPSPSDSSTKADNGSSKGNAEPKTGEECALKHNVPSETYANYSHVSGSGFYCHDGFEDHENQQLSRSTDNLDFTEVRGKKGWRKKQYASTDDSAHSQTTSSQPTHHYHQHQHQHQHSRSTSAYSSRPRAAGFAYSAANGGGGGASSSSNTNSKDSSRSSSASQILPPSSSSSSLAERNNFSSSASVRSSSPPPVSSSSVAGGAKSFHQHYPPPASSSDSYVAKASATFATAAAPQTPPSDLDLSADFPPLGREPTESPTSFVSPSPSTSSLSTAEASRQITAITSKESASDSSSAVAATPTPVTWPAVKGNSDPPPSASFSSDPQAVIEYKATTSNSGDELVPTPLSQPPTSNHAPTASSMQSDQAPVNKSTVELPPDITMAPSDAAAAAGQRQASLPDIATQAANVLTTSSGDVTPEQQQEQQCQGTASSSGAIAVNTVRSVEIVTNEEDYNSGGGKVDLGHGQQANRAAVVILSTRKDDWNANSSDLEFGGPVNHSLLQVQPSTVDYEDPSIVGIGQQMDPQMSPHADVVRAGMAAASERKDTPHAPQKDLYAALTAVVGRAGVQGDDNSNSSSTRDGNTMEIAEMMRDRWLNVVEEQQEPDGGGVVHYDDLVPRTEAQ